MKKIIKKSIIIIMIISIVFPLFGIVRGTNAAETAKVEKYGYYSGAHPTKANILEDYRGKINVNNKSYNIIDAVINSVEIQYKYQIKVTYTTTSTGRLKVKGGYRSHSTAQSEGETWANAYAGNTTVGDRYIRQNVGSNAVYTGISTDFVYDSASGLTGSVYYFIEYTNTTYSSGTIPIDWSNTKIVDDSKIPGHIKMHASDATIASTQVRWYCKYTIEYDTSTSGEDVSEPSTGETTTPSNGGSTGGTTTPSNGGSTGGTTTPPNTGVISENTVYTNDLSVGDQLKFVANSWNIKTGDGQGNSGKYLSTDDLMEILAKGSSNNYLQVKMLSGEYKDQTVWIYYGSTGTTNFTKVKTAEITTPSNDSEDSKQTETLDNGTATENVIKFVKQVYGTESISKDSQVVKDLLSKSKTASDVVSSYLMGVMNAGLDLEGFIKMTYQRALGREATEEEIKKYTESAEASESSEDKGVLYSQVVADVLATNEFKLVCENYGIELGSYTATTYNADTTQEKASNFVKHLYSSVFNKNMTTEQVSNIADNLVAGKITASGVMKAFFESDNIKNLKLSDEEFVKRLGKACFNQDLPSDKVTEYTNKLSSGTNRNELLKEFLTKTDFQNLCNTYGLTKGTYTPGKMTSTETLADEFVINVHKAVFGEDSQVLSVYTNGLVNGNSTAASVIQDYIESANFKTKITTENISDEQYVKILFKAVLQRDPSSAELSEYVAKLDSSNKITILEDMFNSKEFTVLCNKYYLTPGGYATVKAEITKTTSSTEGGARITSKEKIFPDGAVIKTVTAVEFDISTGVKGDVNGDGSADARDASLILIYVSANQLNFVKPTEEVLKVADIEGNKKITADDASYILEFSATRGVSGKEISSESIWEEILKEKQTEEETVEEITTEESNSENANETTNNTVTNEIENNSVNNTTVDESTNNAVSNEIVAENIVNSTTNSTTVENETSNSVIE